MIFSYDWIWSPSTNIACLIWSISTNSNVSLISPSKAPRIFYQPAGWVSSCQYDTMIWCSLSTVSKSSRTVILPSICIYCNWKGLILESFNDDLTVIAKLNIVFDPVFGFVFRYDTTSKSSSIRIIGLKKNSKILDIPVGVTCPTSYTSIVLIGSWTVNDFLFCEV